MWLLHKVTLNKRYAYIITHNTTAVIPRLYHPWIKQF